VPLRVIPVTLAGTLATLLLAWAYGWISAFLPSVVTAMAVVIFAAATGFIAWCVARIAKVRHPRWMGRLGLVIGFFAWYVQWAAFLVLASDDGSVAIVNGFSHLLVNPRDMVTLIATLAKMRAQASLVTGSFFDTTFIGWCIEFALLLAVPSLFGKLAAAEPFCEVSNNWMETSRIAGRFRHIEAADDVRSLLETHPLDLFSLLAPHVEGQSPHHALVEIHHGYPQRDFFVSIVNVEVSNNKQKLETRKTPVTSFLRISDMSADDAIRKLTRLSSHIPTPASAPEDPPELEQAIRHLKASEFEAVIGAAQPFVKAERPDLRRDANRLCALSTARLGRWDESLVYWKALFADEHTAHNALQLASTSAMAGKLDDAEHWIEETREINTSTRELPGLMMQTNFITALCQSGRAQAALPYLDEIKSVYEQIGITDPTQLYLRQLPLFDAFLNNSAPVIRAALSPEHGRAWYQSMLPHLDDHGQSCLKDWLDRHFFTAQAKRPHVHPTQNRYCALRLMKLSVSPAPVSRRKAPGRA
jgi:hypothetical protein